MKLGLSQFVAVCLLAGGFGWACDASAQQFGPSPQAMYQQHPGSAPTFVNYGTPALTAKIKSPSTLAGQTSPAPVRPTAQASTPRVSRPTTTTHRKLTTRPVGAGR